MIDWVNTEFNFYPADIREAVGRLMIIGYEGQDKEDMLQLVTRFRPAGLIFFKRNYPQGGQGFLKEALSECQKLASNELGRPLLMAIDNEGGLVRRLPEPFLQLPSASDMAKSGVPAIEELAYRSGQELFGLGFNFNLAPVMDLEQGSFIGSRSFGSVPEMVSACAQSFMAGMARAGVLSCGKHFPGLGAAEVDPHYQMPVVDKTLEELEAHMRPFWELSSDLPAVMTSHVLYPALDKERSATFSKTIVAFIKDRSDFLGPVLSDDLEMGAVTGFSPGQAAVKAVGAGHDLLLICRRLDLIVQAQEALTTAIEKAVIDRQRLDDACFRLRHILERLSVAARKEEE